MLNGGKSFSIDNLYSGLKKAVQNVLNFLSEGKPILYAKPLIKFLNGIVLSYMRAFSSPILKGRVVRDVEGVYLISVMQFCQLFWRY